MDEDGSGEVDFEEFCEWCVPACIIGQCVSSCDLTGVALCSLRWIRAKDDVTNKWVASLQSKMATGVRITADGNMARLGFAAVGDAVAAYRRLSEHSGDAGYNPIFCNVDDLVIFAAEEAELETFQQDVVGFDTEMTNTQIIGEEITSIERGVLGIKRREAKERKAWQVRTHAPSAGARRTHGCPSAASDWLWTASYCSLGSADALAHFTSASQANFDYEAQQRQKEVGDTYQRRCQPPGYAVPPAGDRTGAGQPPRPPQLLQVRSHRGVCFCLDGAARGGAGGGGGGGGEGGGGGGGARGSRHEDPGGDPRGEDAAKLCIQGDGGGAGTSGCMLPRMCDAWPGLWWITCLMCVCAQPVCHTYLMGPFDV